MLDCRSTVISNIVTIFKALPAPSTWRSFQGNKKWCVKKFAYYADHLQKLLRFLKILRALQLLLLSGLLEMYLRNETREWFWFWDHRVCTVFSRNSLSFIHAPTVYSFFRKTELHTHSDSTLNCPHICPWPKALWTIAERRWENGTQGLQQLVLQVIRKWKLFTVYASQSSFECLGQTKAEFGIWHKIG